MTAGLHASIRKELAVMRAGFHARASLAAFALFQAAWWYFPSGFFASDRADAGPFFASMPAALAFLAAALSLRSWNEEARQGTLDLVLGMPGDAAIPVAGKFLAQAAYLGAALAATLPAILGASLLGRFDPGLAAACYLGAFLSGCGWLAIAQAWSALAGHQGGAFLGTAFTCLVLLYADRFADFAGLGGAAAGFFNAVSPGRHGRAFTLGLVDAGEIAWFLAFQAFFLALARHGLERRRWK